MLQTLGSVGHALYTRAIVDNDGKVPSGGDDVVYEAPAWAWLVALLNVIVFLPAIVVLEYTLKTVYPIFAIVEDEKPPAYEPVSLDASDAASLPEAPISGSKPTRGNSHTVTSSLRATNRLLMANGGFRALFRGLACFLAQSLFNLFLMGIFMWVLGPGSTPIATLLASLALVQYSTAWVHIVISEVSPLHFWRRLPPFKRTFEATWRSVAIYWAATEVARWIPQIVGLIMGLSFTQLGSPDPNEVANNPGRAVGGLFVLVLGYLGAGIFLILPAHVVLVRVQASLLPEDQDTIIPFDRTFEGKVEPAVVGGLGHATVTDAWATFSRAAWRRLVMLYVKIYVVVVAGWFLIFALVGPQGALVAKHTTKTGGGDDDL